MNTITCPVGDVHPDNGQATILCRCLRLLSIHPSTRAVTVATSVTRAGQSVTLPQQYRY